MILYARQHHPLERIQFVPTFKCLEPFSHTTFEPLCQAGHSIFMYPILSLFHMLTFRLSPTLSLEFEQWILHLCYAKAKFQHSKSHKCDIFIVTECFMQIMLPANCESITRAKGCFLFLFSIKK